MTYLYISINDIVSAKAFFAIAIRSAQGTMLGLILAQAEYYKVSFSVRQFTF